MRTSGVNSCGIPVSTDCLATRLWSLVSWLQIPVSFSKENVSRIESCSFGMQCSFDGSCFSAVIRPSWAWDCSLESCGEKSFESYVKMYSTIFVRF